MLATSHEFAQGTRVCLSIWVFMLFGLGWAIYELNDIGMGLGELNNEVNECNDIVLCWPHWAE